MNPVQALRQRAIANRSVLAKADTEVAKENVDLARKLMAHKPFTPKQLADHMGVSLRVAYRILATLANSGQSAKVARRKEHPRGEHTGYYSTRK